MAFEAIGLSCGYGDEPVVRDVSFSLEPREVLCVLGPNGVGKTTLFKTLLGFIPAKAGEVRVDGRPLGSMSRTEVARAVAYVPQSQTLPFSYSVEEFVLMGRAPRLRLLQQPGPDDRRVVREVMARMGIEHLAKKPCTGVSGGEMQLACVARALAQEPCYLVMDEPTASLDFGNQARVLALVGELAEAGIGVVMTTHDPAQAFSLRSQVVLLQSASRCLAGPVREVLTEEELSRTYGVEVWVGDLSRGGREVACCVVPPAAPGASADPVPAAPADPEAAPATAATADGSAAH